MSQSEILVIYSSVTDTTHLLLVLKPKACVSKIRILSSRAEGVAWW